MFSDSTEIREHIEQFYKQLYFEQLSWRPKLDGPFFNSVGADEGSWLERAFEECKVFEVGRALNEDKAPDPDGYSVAFFQTCWVIKEDFMDVSKEFRI
jgi:hypothetical protein